MIKIKQGDIVTIDFDPSKGSKIRRNIGHLNVAEFLLISQYTEHNFR